MKRRIEFIVLLITVSAPALTQPALAGEEDIDFLLGQDGSAQHQLVISDPDGHHFLSGEQILLFPGDGLNDGYFVSEFPGWSAKEGIPAPLLAGHELTLNRLGASTTAFDMLDPFTGTPILGTDGESFLFPFAGGLGHEDVFYRADGSQVHAGDSFTVWFQLTDPSGLELASQPFALGFLVAPEPTTGFLLAFMSGLVLRRRPSERALKFT